MVPLIENSVETLIDVLSKTADTGKSLEISEYVHYACIHVRQFTESHACNHLIYRTLESFTLEIVFATGFGRVIDVQRGEDNSLINATADLSKTFKKHLAYTDVLLSM